MNLGFLLFSVDQFSNLGRFPGQDFEIALLWAQIMRPVFGKFAAIGGVVPGCCKTSFGSTPWRKQHCNGKAVRLAVDARHACLYTMYHTVVPQPALVAEAATERAVKAGENLSADLVEVANSGAAKVSLNK